MTICCFDGGVSKVPRRKERIVSNECEGKNIIIDLLDYKSSQVMVLKKHLSLNIPKSIYFSSSMPSQGIEFTIRNYNK